MSSAANITSPGFAAVPGADERVDPARVVAFLAMCFGMFMAFLDIQVVSASLAQIQAGLAASSDEITWVQTSYLMAEVVAIPLSGFLSRALGTRIMFAVAAAGFTVASLMCGLSTTMDQMIVWRALQGFIGGGMVPTVFASAYTIFPRSRMMVITPLIGLVATLAPTIGPTVGGYLDRGVLLALAVLHQHRARHHRHHRGGHADRLRPARFQAVREVRLARPHLHGAVSRRARIRARRRAALGLVRGFDDCARRGGVGRRRRGILPPRPHCASSRSSICAPSSIAISPSAACSRSCSASASTG